MIGDLFMLYMEGFSAFYRGIFGSGMFQWIVIGFLIWWFFGKKGGRCCCGHCGCWCGRCRCDEVRMEHAEAEPVKKTNKSRTSKASKTSKPEG